MNRIAILVLTCVLSAAAARAQETAGARATALGGSAVMLDDGWSAFHNQAGLAALGGFSAGAFFENRFMMAELNDKGLFLAQPVRSGCIGVSFRSFGYSAYSRSHAGLAYALRFSEKFYGGVQLNYHVVRIAEGYGARQAMTVEGGMLYRMNDQLTIGAHLSNPTRAQLAEYRDERLPSTLRAGLSYRFSERVQVVVQVEKASDQEVRLRGGIEYLPAEKLVLRIGSATQPGATSFGIGWMQKNWRADIAAGWHPVLGFTPHLSLNYGLRRHDD